MMRRVRNASAAVISVYPYRTPSTLELSSSEPLPSCDLEASKALTHVYGRRMRRPQVSQQEVAGAGTDVARPRTQPQRGKGSAMMTHVCARRMGRPKVNQAAGAGADAIPARTQTA